jgi:mono/diheme cytochrome c family protein
MRRVAVLSLLFLFIASAVLLAGEESIWTAPEAEKQKKNPAKGDAASEGRGGDLYRKQCVSCHGESGSGDGPIAERLGFFPGDLTDVEVMKTQTDGEIFWKIANGRGPMPGFKTTMGSTDAQIWDLVNFTRSLSTSPGKEGDDKDDK